MVPLTFIHLSFNSLSLDRGSKRKIPLKTAYSDPSTLSSNPYIHLTFQKTSFKFACYRANAQFGDRAMMYQFGTPEPGSDTVETMGL